MKYDENFIGSSFGMESGRSKAATCVTISKGDFGLQVGSCSAHTVVEGNSEGFFSR
jgi:hypothetical protein